MACCRFLPSSSHLSCVSVMPQVKPTAWAGPSTAGWASGQGRRRRARPRSSRSSPASLPSHAAHRSATPSAVTVSAGGLRGLRITNLCTLPTPHPSVLVLCPARSPWIRPAPHSFHRALLAGSGLEPGPGVDAAPAEHPARGQLGSSCSNIFLWALGSKVRNGVDREGVVGLPVPSPHPELRCCETSVLWCCACLCVASAARGCGKEGL